MRVSNDSNTTCQSILLSGLEHEFVNFPCLKINVTVISTDIDTNYSTTTAVDDDPRGIEVRHLSEDHSSSIVEYEETSSLLLFQNELSYFGNDHLHQPCSYLPQYCNRDAHRLKNDIREYVSEYGRVDSTYDCFYSKPNRNSGGRVILNRVLEDSLIINISVWPAVGVVTSIFLCYDFWRRNHTHLPRLFVYNSWQ